jgi:hypothetical protein
MNLRNISSQLGQSGAELLLLLIGHLKNKMLVSHGQQKNEKVRSNSKY